MVFLRLSAASLAQSRVMKNAGCPGLQYAWTAMNQTRVDMLDRVTQVTGVCGWCHGPTRAPLKTPTDKVIKVFPNFEEVKLCSCCSCAFILVAMLKELRFPFEIGMQVAQMVQVVIDVCEKMLNLHAWGRSSDEMWHAEHIDKELLEDRIRCLIDEKNELKRQLEAKKKADRKKRLRSESD